VIDVQQKRLDAAQRFGATDVIDSTKSKPVEAVRDLLPGGADHVFDFVGLKLVAEEGLGMLDVGGGLYLVGVAKPEVDISVNIFDAVGGQKRVLGVNFGSTNAKRDIPMYAELYLQGLMNLDDLVSKKISLRDVNDGYAALKDGSLNRVVVKESTHGNSHKRHGENNHHALYRWSLRGIPWQGSHGHH
jgi:S-(hydroxymethyl)glutathione dehydrogenase/alcohol dehydrogenase